MSRLQLGSLYGNLVPLSLFLTTPPMGYGHPQNGLGLLVIAGQQLGSIEEHYARLDATDAG